MSALQGARSRPNRQAQLALLAISLKRWDCVMWLWANKWRMHPPRISLIKVPRSTAPKAAYRMSWGQVLSQLSHACKAEKIYHPEVSGNLTASLRQRWAPTWIVRQVGITGDLEHADDDFAHDTAADGTEMKALFHDLSFLENVVPERRGLVELLTVVL